MPSRKDYGTHWEGMEPLPYGIAKTWSRIRRGGPPGPPVLIRVVETPTPTTPQERGIEFVGEGSEATRAAMNDSPVDCQNREWTEPQRDLSALPNRDDVGIDPYGIAKMWDRKAPLASPSGGGGICEANDGEGT